MSRGVDGVQNFEAFIDKRKKGASATQGTAVVQCLKVDVEVSRNEYGRLKARDQGADMGQEVRVVILTSHFNVGVGEIDVDNMNVTSEANTVEFDGALKSGSIAG